MNERVRCFKVKEKTIVVVDYSDLKEEDMLSAQNRLAEVVMGMNIAVRIISKFNSRCYISSKFMRQVEDSTKVALHLIESQAVVGLTPVKKLILKGYNFMFNLDIRNFETEEDAITFLTRDCI